MSAAASPATGAARAPIETDAVIVGAGPVGLFQAFELGLLEMRAHIVDSLPAAGGQCIELYADKPIYDIPGTPACSARELIERLLLQVKPFNPQFHFDQQVDRVERQDDGRFLVETSTGLTLLTKTFIIASGVGSFQPRRLKLDGLEAFSNTQMFYSAAAALAAIAVSATSAPSTAPLASQRVVVIGDTDAALECCQALALTKSSSGVGGIPCVAQVTLMHRRDEFKATPETVAQIRQLRDAGALEFIAAQPTGFEQIDNRLTALTVLGADGSTRALPLDTLIVLTGLSPKLGPIAEWGLALERKQLRVDTEKFQTSEPGIFAVGDVNTYPGKKKLIVCGFHEATLAAYAAVAHAYPARAVPLEYTTTSPRLQRVLARAATEPDQSSPDRF